MRPTVIHLHLHAPAKPVVGKPCNGCGVCCAFAPCPLGVLVSGRWHGTCAALRWQSDALRYTCTLVSDPAAVWLGMPMALRAPLQRLAKRWIAAGVGCDSDLETAVAAPASGPG